VSEAGALDIRAHGGGVRFAVRVQPRAASAGVAGVHGGALKVRLTAPPVEGAANDALVAFLAGALGVPRRAVRIVSGAAARTKVVEVEGADEARVRRLAGEGS
jgi:uncharacterized protein (TIGR00251 family)